MNQTRRPRYVVESTLDRGKSRTVVYAGSDRKEAERLTNFWDAKVDTWLTDTRLHPEYWFESIGADVEARMLKVADRIDDAGARAASDLRGIYWRLTGKSRFDTD